VIANRDGGLKIVAGRDDIEKIIERELSGIFRDSLKVAEKEGKPYVKEALQLILVVIEARRGEREKARANEP
jgi:hypothetical protein